MFGELSNFADMNLRRSFLSFLLAAVAAGISASSPAAWERVVSAPAPTTQDSELSDAYVSDGYAYITLRETTEVKLFTILGQLICSERLTPGTYRLRLTSRGVHILKTATAARRLIY